MPHIPTLLDRTGRPLRHGIVVGVAGPIAAGKSTASLFLAGFGAHEIDVDEIGHHMLRDAKVVRKITSYFGDGVLDSSGHLSRWKLAQIAFSSDDEIRMLNDILHPLIIAETRREVDESRHEGSMLVINAALLFEAGIDRYCDFIIIVTADEKLREHRAISKRGWPPGEMVRRESYHMPLSEKIARSDFVIHNNGTYEDLHYHVEKVYKEILDGKKPKTSKAKHQNTEG